MPDRPRSFSPSSAGVWKQCPRRWRYRYVERLPDPPGIPALIGTFAHRVLELLCDEPAADRTVDRARELAGQAWPETVINPDFVALGLDDRQVHDFRWKAWTAIEGLWAYAKRTFASMLILMDDLGNTRKVQSLVEQAICEVPARYLRGRIGKSLRAMRAYLENATH